MLSQTDIAGSIAAARADWGLSTPELARLAKVTEGAARAAERTGRAEASALSALAEALGGSLDDLLAGRPFWKAPALALKTSGVPEPSMVRPGLARVARAASDVAALSALLGRPNLWAKSGSSLGPIGLLADDIRQAEVLAGLVRAKLQNRLEPLVPIRAAMQRLGVATFLSEFADEDVDGAMWRASGEAPNVVVNCAARGGLVTAIRMTLAHELCHALFDRPQLGVAGNVEMRSDHGGRRERRANAFAAYFLAPRSGVRRFLREAGIKGRPSAQHLMALSRQFGMGVEAMARHLENCGIWTEDDFQANHGLFSPEFRSDDDRELRAANGEQQIALERRGLLLDLATQALDRDLISLSRWRELLGLSRWSEWEIILQARHVDLRDESSVAGID